MNTRLAAIVALALTLGGCARPSSESARNDPAPGKPNPGQTAEPVKINIDEIFPGGPGRELTLNNCTSCHTFVPIVVLQMNKEAWERNERIHRSRVPGLSDDEFKTLYVYLQANFNPDHPVPKLPKELLDTWTSY
jgi:hypothetical protein